MARRSGLYQRSQWRRSGEATLHRLCGHWAAEKSGMNGMGRMNCQVKTRQFPLDRFSTSAPKSLALPLPFLEANQEERHGSRQPQRS
jgi:hypothetical protein